MAYTYTTIDGKRVETNVAAAFQRLRAAFKSRWGVDLLVSSGTRTRAEQQHLYDLYKAGKGNLAAKPGYSNHEESGPRGPRALDVRDSGADAGVTVNGSARANWLKANASSCQFDPAGYRFSQREPWHIEFTGSLASASTTVRPGSLITFAQAIALAGWIGRPYDSREYWADLQQNGIWQGVYTGKVDGKPGPLSFAAEKKLWEMNVKKAPTTVRSGSKLTFTEASALAGWLGRDYDSKAYWVDLQTQASWIGAYPSSEVDGIPGPKTFTAEKALFDHAFAAPVEPEVPEVPVEPEIPVDPEIPEEPVDPETPVVPEIPGEPEKPVKPKPPVTGWQAAIAAAAVILIVGVLAAIGQALGWGA